METTITTPPREKVMAMIFEAFDQVNEQGFSNGCLVKSPDTEIYGALDSLGFVNLIASIEELCEREFGAVISLSDAAEGSSENPFQTVGTLCDVVISTLSQRR